MILCENNNCKIGWLHFGCVAQCGAIPETTCNVVANVQSAGHRQSHL